MAMGKSSGPVSLSRRAFFSGRAAAPITLPMRPPWALFEQEFLKSCTTCDDCRTACDEGIIVRGAGGYPEVDFSNGECTFCADCARACKTGALSVQNTHDLKPWALKAQIGANCLSDQGVTCRVCGDRCDARAIRFQLAVGGRATPILDQTSCTGCGACVAPCPTGTIEIIQPKSEEQP